MSDKTKSLHGLSDSQKGKSFQRLTFIRFFFFTLNKVIRKLPWQREKRQIQWGFLLCTLTFSQSMVFKLPRDVIFKHFKIQFGENIPRQQHSAYIWAMWNPRIPDLGWHYVPVGDYYIYKYRNIVSAQIWFVDSTRSIHSPKYTHDLSMKN